MFVRSVSLLRVFIRFVPVRSVHEKKKITQKELSRVRMISRCFRFLLRYIDPLPPCCPRAVPEDQNRLGRYEKFHWKGQVCSNKSYAIQFLEQHFCKDPFQEATDEKKTDVSTKK